MTQEFLVPALGLFTLGSALILGSYRLARVRAKIKRDERRD